MDNLTLDYLPNHPEIKLYQHKKMFRINTDTCLLGEFLDFTPNKKVLDIGTNNGALLLYASLLNPIECTGIDINNDALSIAKQNLDLNNIKNYTLINIDINKYHTSNKYDVIICNPPYFVSSEELKNKNEYLKMARHEEYLTLKELINTVNHLLKDDGVFYLIHRYVRLNDIIEELNNNNLFINKQKTIYDQNKVEPISVLLEITKIKKDIILENKTIYR